jgi:hypothetical protein
LNGSATLFRNFEPVAAAGQADLLNYETLGLEDIHLGFPGNFPESAPIHGSLGHLRPGVKLAMGVVEANGIGLFDEGDVCVARLSRKAEADWSARLALVREVRVLAMIGRSAEQDDELSRRERYRVAGWEIPIVEIVLKSNHLNSG